MDRWVWHEARVGGVGRGWVRGPGEMGLGRGTGHGDPMAVPARTPDSWFAPRASAEREVASRPRAEVTAGSARAIRKREPSFVTSALFTNVGWEGPGSNGWRWAAFSLCVSGFCEAHRAAPPPACGARRPSSCPVRGLGNRGASYFQGLSLLSAEKWEPSCPLQAGIHWPRGRQPRSPSAAQREGEPTRR